MSHHAIFFLMLVHVTVPDNQLTARLCKASAMERLVCMAKLKVRLL